jgi:hypothetical protein
MTPASARRGAYAASTTRRRARLGFLSGGLGYWVAAARECFEEAGIFWRLMKKFSRQPGAPALEHARAPELAGTLPFSEILENEGLYIPAQEIAYYSHWITAPGRPRRFSTRFFVACAPAGQHGAHDRSETVHSVWVSPREALERGERKEIELIFPTRSTLADLAHFRAPREVFEHAKNLGDIQVNAACWALDHEGSQRLFRSSDAPYHEIHWSDPEEKGNTCFVIQPGIPKRLDKYVTRLTASNPGVMTGPGTNTYLVGDGDLAVIDPGPALDAHIAKILERARAASAGSSTTRTWTIRPRSPRSNRPRARRCWAARARRRSQDHVRADPRADGDRVQLGWLNLRARSIPRPRLESPVLPAWKKPHVVTATT